MEADPPLRARARCEDARALNTTFAAYYSPILLNPPLSMSSPASVISSFSSPKILLRKTQFFCPPPSLLEHISERLEHLLLFFCPAISWCGESGFGQPSACSRRNVFPLLVRPMFPLWRFPLRPFKPVFFSAAVLLPKKPQMRDYWLPTVLSIEKIPPLRRYHNPSSPLRRYKSFLIAARSVKEPNF